MPKKITTTKKVTTNKIAPKKAIKKVSPKKVALPKKKVSTAAKKVTTKKPLVYADNDHSFWVSNGQVLNSLIALQQALANMEKEVFEHHVSDEKHDFADWVEVVLCDGKCASDLRKSKTPDKACGIVDKHLKTYKI